MNRNSNLSPIDPGRPRGVVTVTAAARQLVAKILEYAVRLDTAFNTKALTADRLTTFQHDLAIFASGEDLAGGHFEVFSSRMPDVTIFAWDFTVPADGGNADNIVTVREPNFRALLPDAGEARFVVTRHSFQHRYANMKLMGDWTTADLKIRPAGYGRVDHAACRGTGGRLTAKAFVAHSNRVELILDTVDGVRGYGFASDADVRNVYIDKREIVPAVTWKQWRAFRPGNRVCALLVPNRRTHGNTPGLTAQAVELI